MKKEKVKKRNLDEFLTQFEEKYPVLFKIVMGIIAGLIFCFGAWLAIEILLKLLFTSFKLTVIVVVCTACVATMLEDGI